MENQTALAWPNGKRVAVAVTVMYETWAEGKAPNYSVQTTHLKPGTVDLAGRAWSTYGGRVGVWRIIRLLDRLQIPATFFINARCAELYPDSVKQIVKSGHDVGGHNYTQDAPARLHGRRTRSAPRSAMPRYPRGQIRQAADRVAQLGARLHRAHGRFPGGRKARLARRRDLYRLADPVETKHGPIAAVPNSDFTDNRVLRSSPRDLWDVYKGTFDYLQRTEPMSLLVLTLHCHFGGRPMITSVFEEVVRYLQQHPMSGSPATKSSGGGRWRRTGRAQLSDRFF